MRRRQHPVYDLCRFLHELLQGEGIAADEIDLLLQGAFDAAQAGDELAVERVLNRIKSEAKLAIVRDVQRVAGSYGNLARKR